MSREDAFQTLIESARVSARTRAILRERAKPDDPAYLPAVLTPQGFSILRAVLNRVLPQTAIDVAQRLDQALAAGTGDGWRFDDVPPDAVAYRQGLAALDDAGFAALDDCGQDALLTTVASGEAALPGPLNALALQRWFEDLRSDAVKLYTAHPRTFARIGYAGFAYGGDAERKQGFRALGPDAREPWEPAP